MTADEQYTRHVLEVVSDFKRMLDQHCSVGDSAHIIAPMYGVTRNTLQVVFKEQYGVSIRHYKLTLRMERSCKLLIEGNNVKEVSIDLHYTTPRAFVHAFKKHYGITPGQYAKQGRLT